MGTSWSAGGEKVPQIPSWWDWGAPRPAPTAVCALHAHTSTLSPTFEKKKAGAPMSSNLAGVCMAHAMAAAMSHNAAAHCSTHSSMCCRCSQAAAAVRRFCLLKLSCSRHIHVLILRLLDHQTGAWPCTAQGCRVTATAAQFTCCNSTSQKWHDLES